MLNMLMITVIAGLGGFLIYSSTDDMQTVLISFLTLLALAGNISIDQDLCKSSKLNKLRWRLLTD